MSRSKAGQFGWREGEAAKRHSGGGLERTLWWVDKGDLFGWEEEFKHDGGSVASEALDPNVSCHVTTRGQVRTCGQSLPCTEDSTAGREQGA